MSTQRGRPFVVGNKFGRGRPQGSRNKTTAAAQELLNEYAGAITKKCIAKALQGDSTCLRLCVERIVAPLRDPAINVRFPRLQSTEGFIAIPQRILSAVSRGAITPAEAAMIANTLETFTRVLHPSNKNGVLLEPKAVMPEFLVEALIEAQDLKRRTDGAAVNPKQMQPDKKTSTEPPGGDLRSEGDFST